MGGWLRVALALAGVGAVAFLLRTGSAQMGHPPGGQMMTPPGGHMMTPPAAAEEEAPIRMTMEELHRSGGTPPGWRFRLPKGDPQAGREVFVKLECFACHRVEGENFPRRDRKPTEVDPDLTGLGGRHPAEYFFESVLHPNRVITQGPGFSGPDGLSIMPSYNHLLSLEEAVNLVAYLKGLAPKGGH